LTNRPPPNNGGVHPRRNLFSRMSFERANISHIPPQLEAALPFNCRTIYGVDDYYFGLRHAAAMALPPQSTWNGPEILNGKAQEQSPFFGRLPPEVRNMIYENLLLEEEGRPLPTWCPAHPRGMTHNPRYHVAILRTCKRVYMEAQAVFYSVMAQRYWFTKYPPPKEYNMLCM
jgi:hypothetical protein